MTSSCYCFAIMKAIKELGNPWEMRIGDGMAIWRIQISGNFSHTLIHIALSQPGKVEKPTANQTAKRYRCCLRPAIPSSPMGLFISADDHCFLKCAESVAFI
eukprot:scaffold162988_cov23-Prasinocladus_malaysianus.AAC.1